MTEPSADQEIELRYADLGALKQRRSIWTFAELLATLLFGGVAFSILLKAISPDAPRDKVAGFILVAFFGLFAVFVASWTIPRIRVLWEFPQVLILKGKRLRSAPGRTEFDLGECEIVPVAPVYHYSFWPLVEFVRITKKNSSLLVAPALLTEESQIALRAAMELADRDGIEIYAEFKQDRTSKGSGNKKAP